MIRTDSSILQNRFLILTPRPLLGFGGIEIRIRDREKAVHASGEGPPLRLQSWVGSLVGASSTSSGAGYLLLGDTWRPGASDRIVGHAGHPDGTEIDHAFKASPWVSYAATCSRSRGAVTRTSSVARTHLNSPPWHPSLDRKHVQSGAVRSLNSRVEDGIFVVQSLDISGT
jgi:hypothetical protein